jgi:hypothetical protein
MFGKMPLLDLGWIPKRAQIINRVAATDPRNAQRPDSDRSLSVQSPPNEVATHHYNACAFY